MSGWTTPSATDGSRGGSGITDRNDGEQPDPVVEDGRAKQTNGFVVICGLALVPRWKVEAS